MNFLQRLITGWRAPMVPTPAAGASLSGRPTYAYLGIANGLIPREQSFELLRQFRRQVPPIKRALEILSGFVGCPELELGENETDEQFLQDWANTVRYGDGVATGFSTWITDLLDSALTFGYGIGEAEIGNARTGVSALWTLAPGAVAFRTNERGQISTVQNVGVGGEVTLSPLTLARVTHRPKNCNPNGESLILTLPAFAQYFLNAHDANGKTWTRTGQPIFHVHTELPADLQDPNGAISNEILDNNKAAWNEVMRSQALDGIAKDFFTVSVGKSLVSVIGADGVVMDIEVTNRVVCEQIVAATGIPPFLFGFQWATTERLSKQQADLLLATIDGLRREIEPAIRQMVDLHIRLIRRPDLMGYTLEWPDVSLQEEEAKARAASMEAAAMVSREKVYKALWQNGVVDQEGYAEGVTGKPEVVEVMNEPPAAPVPSFGGNTPPENAMLLTASAVRKAWNGAH
jgi:hypothetical protein